MRFRCVALLVLNVVQWGKGETSVRAGPNDVGGFRTFPALPGRTHQDSALTSCHCERSERFGVPALVSGERLGAAGMDGTFSEHTCGDRLNSATYPLFIRL